MTLPIRYRARFPGAYVCVCSSRSVRWRRRCLSLYVSGLFAARVPFSLDPGASKSPGRLRQCSDRTPKTPMRRSTPSFALSSVVESSQPDDGGQSTTLLLVAFPLPSCSLLAGPDAAISPRTRTKSRLARVSFCPVSFNFRGPTDKRNQTANIFPGYPSQFSSTESASARSCSRNTPEYTCEFAFSSAKSMWGRWFHEELAKNQRSRERQVWSSFHLRLILITL